MAEMGMRKQFGSSIQVEIRGETARIHISERWMSARNAHAFKCLLNEAIRHAEQYDKEQELKNHPSLFSDETD
jgi:hypothetical protein